MENSLRWEKTQREPNRLGVLGVFEKVGANPEMNNPHDLTFDAKQKRTGRFRRDVTRVCMRKNRKSGVSRMYARQPVVSLAHYTKVKPETFKNMIHKRARRDPILKEQCLFPYDSGLSESLLHFSFALLRVLCQSDKTD